jgi:hypothetical protein
MQIEFKSLCRTTQIAIRREAFSRDLSVAQFLQLIEAREEDNQKDIFECTRPIPDLTDLEDDEATLPDLPRHRLHLISK